jgi:hypothetical protein
MKSKHVPSKCEVPMCKEKPDFEVHLIIPSLKNPNFIVYFLCEEHYKAEDRYWAKVRQQREIYDLRPEEDDTVKVQFT